MSKPPRKPKYRRQRRSGRPDLAFVEIGKQRRYLGEYDSDEANSRYEQLLAELRLPGGAVLQSAPKVSPATQQPGTEGATVEELSAAYWAHCEVWYQNAKSRHRVKRAIRGVVKPYGSVDVRRFGPLKLTACKQRWIDAGLSVKTINAFLAIVKAMFGWGVSLELVPTEVHTALLTVRNERKGRTKAKAPRKVYPVPEKHINAVKPHVSRQVWGLIRLQLLTAARSGELLPIRLTDIDMSRSVWVYKPEHHKNEHRDHVREIFIGPQGQAVIAEFMTGRPVNCCLFSPRDTLREKYAACETHRHQPVKAPKTGRRVRDCYTSDSYRRAIERACIAAGVPMWTPHRLRHAAGTRIRQEYGLEAAQVLLGHARFDMAEHYSEKNREEGLRVAEKIG